MHLWILDVEEAACESTFSRTFTEFAEAGLAERTHAALVLDTLGDRLLGHISRDGTALETRKKPAKKPVSIKTEGMDAPEAAPAEKKKRGCPRKGEIREAKPGKLEQQQGKPLARLLEELPRDCDRGNKCNAQGYKNSWNGYKLHIDTADCGIPVSALLSSASMHDSLAAIPLSLMTAQRYKERSQAERTNARLKDDYGGRHIRVRENAKVMSHLMFGVLR